MYVYFANMVRVVDGDTVVLDWDLGRRTWARGERFRIAGISARESWMEGGPEATLNLANLIPFGAQLVIRSIKVDRDPADAMSFDRYVIVAQLPDGRDLATVLVGENWATWWDGKTRPIPYPPWPRPE